MAGTLKPSKSQAELQAAAVAGTEKLNIIAQNMAEVTQKAETKKEKAKEVQMLTVNIPKSHYEEYKKLFGGSGYSLAKGTRMCLDYIYREIMDGRLELTESGLRETLSSRLTRK